MSQHYLGAWHISFTKTVLIAWLHHEDPMVLHREALSGVGGGAPYWSGHIQTGSQSTGLPGVVLAEQNVICRVVFLVSHTVFLSTCNPRVDSNGMNACCLDEAYLVSEKNSGIVKLALVPGFYPISPSEQVLHRFWALLLLHGAGHLRKGLPSSVRFLWIQQSSRDCVSMSHRARCGCDRQDTALRQEIHISLDAAWGELCCKGRGGCSEGLQVFP